MTRDANKVPEETLEDLKRHFSEGEIVEIACVVGLFAYFNRFNEALAMKPTQPGEGVDS